MADLLGHSITYRIAFGPQAGRKAFALQTVPAREPERFCRYIARPAISTKRLALTNQGNIRYTLKTPYSDGTTHIVLEPLDFMYRMYGMSRAQEAHERPWPG